MIYVYSLAFKGFNSMGYATALGPGFCSMIIFILTLIVLAHLQIVGLLQSQKGN